VSKFAIVATFEVAEGRMGEFLPLLLAHRDRRRGLPGAWNGASVARMRAESAGMVVELTGIRCSLLD
jgi:hypothetical protein